MSTAQPDKTAIAPRLLTRKAAAAYIGVAPGTFDRLVGKGILPARIEALGRWDIRALDATIDELSGRVPARDPPDVVEDNLAKWRRERAERKAKQAAAPVSRRQRRGP